MYDLRVLSDAQADRNRELAWSVQNWGRGHAKAFFSEIVALLDRLRELPLSHQAHPSGRYRVLRHKGLAIPYHVGDHTVTVLAFIGRNRFHELEQIVRRRLARVK